MLMKKPLTDDEFWELVDKFERKDISVEEAIKEICSHTNSYSVASADFSLLCKRDITKEERNLIRAHTNG